MQVQTFFGRTFGALVKVVSRHEAVFTLKDFEREVVAVIPDRIDLPRQ